MNFTAATSAELREQILAAAHDGSLPAGTKLPTVRALADQLGLAVNTVAKAYRELEATGIIDTRGRAGSFVSLSSDSAEHALQLDAAAYAARARSLGVDPERASGFIAAAFGP